MLVGNAAESAFDGRFARGVLWNLISTALAQGSTFLTSIILGRLLGREVFGEFGMVQSTLLMLFTVSQLAAGLMSTKYVAEFRDTNRERAGRVLGLASVLTLAMGALATLLLIVGASPLADRVLHASHLSSGIMLSAGFVLFSVMNAYQVGALAGLESYKNVAIFGTLTACAHVIVCSGGAVLWGLPGALAGVTISAFFRWAVYARVLHRELRKHRIVVQRREGLRDKEILLHFALPAALSGLISTPALWLGNIFLVRQANGYFEMGLYTAANNFRILFLFLPALFNSVAISLLNSHKGKGNLHSYKRVFSLNLGLTVGSAIAGAAVLCLVGESALQIFGKEFVEGNANVIMLVMASAVVFEATGGAVYQLIQGHQKMWWSLGAIILPRDILIVLCAFWLTRQYGATGLAGAHAIGSLFGLVMISAISMKLNLHNRI